MMEPKMRTRDEYVSLRRRYLPEAVKLVIVAESPPASGNYFYDSTGKVTEPLFSALMKQIGAEPRNKEDGLNAFKQSGWVLVDATYEPVNKLSNAQRDRIIERDYPLLISDLSSLVGGGPVPVVLMKANICRLLENRLKQSGFNVINKARVIYFPGAGQQGRFHSQFGEVVRSNAGC
jgi:hypothetical protein